MAELQKFINRLLVLDYAYLSKVASSLLIIFILWLVRFLILKFVQHQTKNPNSLYSWKKGTLYTFVFFAIILIGRHWLNGLEPILAFLGIIAAALTISLKEVVLNFASIWIILWRDIFVVGDRIEISNHKGDVVGLGLFYFSVLEIGKWVDAEQSTGRLIKVPNSLVLTQPIINYTKSFPFVWDEISICVTFESNWKKARNIIQEIAERLTEDKTKQVEKSLNQSEDELIHFQHLEPKVYIKPSYKGPTGVILTLRYLCEPRKRRDKENELWEAILLEFEADSEIELSKQ